MYDGGAIIRLYSPLCSPRKTSLNLRKGLPNSPEADIVIVLISSLNYNFTVILITENYMNNDSSSHWSHSCSTHTSAAPPRYGRLTVRRASQLSKITSM